MCSTKLDGDTVQMAPDKEDPLGFCRGVTNALMIEAVIAGLVGIGFLIYQTFIR